MLQKVYAENGACSSWHEAPRHCLADAFCQGYEKGQENISRSLFFCTAGLQKSLSPSLNTCTPVQSEKAKGMYNATKWLEQDFACFVPFCAGPRKTHPSLNQLERKTALNQAKPTCSSTGVMGLTPMASQPICNAATAAFSGCSPACGQGWIMGSHPVPG